MTNSYLISDWKGAGLEKPSIARADKIALIPAGYLGTVGRIGKLCYKDIQAITKILAEINA